MREIKFRAWDFSNDCFEYSDKTNCCSFDAVSYDNNNMMQYTGLKDKNGVEIYEGDILKSSRDNIHWIRYDALEARYEAVNKDEDYGACHISKRWVDRFSKEVVGNIYENKELLNER